jgi:molybdate transport system substrate-binding protein
VAGDRFVPAADRAARPQGHEDVEAKHGRRQHERQRDQGIDDPTAAPIREREPSGERKSNHEQNQGGGGRQAETEGDGRPVHRYCASYVISADSTSGKGGLKRLQLWTVSYRTDWRRTLAALAFLAGAWVLASCRVVAAQTLTVAAASDLQTALPAIAAQFEKDTGHKVTLTFGSSGNFFTQIQNGAPFDVFLSADVEYPRRLERAALAERGSQYEYATGRLVLWTRLDSGIDIRQGLSVLADARVRRIAIANPEHAPYGRAAVAALRHEQLYDRVREKFVFGENISQAAQFAQSGGADVGVLALSLALSPTLKSSGSHVDIPESLYPPIEQAAIVVASSRQKALARQFVEYLGKPETVQILRANGFGVPQPAAR